MATDALRIAGFGAVLGDGVDCELVPLSAPKGLASGGLELVLIDASTTGHLFELIATFRRLRPQLRLIVVGAEHGSDYVERVIAAGAKGYLAHSASAEDVRLAVSVCAMGRCGRPGGCSRDWWKARGAEPTKNVCDRV